MATASPTFVTISALDAGQISLPEHMFVNDADPVKKTLVPSLSFLIRHPEPDGSVTNLVFDLGVKRDLKYTPAQQAELAIWQPIITDTDCAQSLHDGPLLDPAKDVDYIIISHAHWDHTGTPSDFPSATFAVGSGTLNLFKHGAGSAYPSIFLNPDELPASRTIEFPPISRTGVYGNEPYVPKHTPLPEDTQAKPPAAAASWTWKPFDELPHTLDFFGDGSLYVVDTPGHIYGHVNLLARLGERRWVYLAGDCCHDRRLVTGEKDIGLYDDGHGGLRSIHTDTAEAKKSLDRLREFAKKKGEEGIEVEIVLAHDPIWRRENAHKCWPGKM
ncbi:Metallo-hydrolase/oxidoreductase [Trichoderma citrinoviride]|uniref:Metallo-hydrolase/oxidoreductase n=1 Tax=Trichoderma citrinoviride TaxID=58853 RepID=A0A2T4BA35_9HYPO|nr:Metallo-hydrolase/oxidoreductase [Trichoderma citrinoviride]PTB66184.1 Metallo-hydrolase/oxidoreductase [Trichoderma citrinoviride]